MPRTAARIYADSAIELTLRPRALGQGVQSWLYAEIRAAILDGRVRRGKRLPATRTLARTYGISRGSVVAVFEQLKAEGYLSPQVGSGTRVSEQLPDDLLEVSRTRTSSTAVSKGDHTLRIGAGEPSLQHSSAPRPFHPGLPALREFPIELWSRLLGRRHRNAHAGLLASGDPAGFRPLRAAIADYLGAARGVATDADHVVVTSGIQQGLDLVARLLLGPGVPVWVEDPAYFGTVSTFRRSGAAIVPVPVDGNGLDVALGRARCPSARLAYVTPGHQFALGVTMSAQRRLELLAWAHEQNGYVAEDDYDGEYRFSGRPIPALHGLDRQDRVLYLGTFNKTLFPSLRLGYLVVPDALLDGLSALLADIDRGPPVLPQAALCDFMAQGLFTRHLRRMRSLYAERLDALRRSVDRYLGGALELPDIAAGLCIPGFLVQGMRSRRAEELARARGLQAFGLHSFYLERREPAGLLLGFAAFDAGEIDRAAHELAAALG